MALVMPVPVSPLPGMDRSVPAASAWRAVDPVSVGSRVALAAAQRFPGIHTRLTTLTSTASGLQETLAVRNVTEFAKDRVSVLGRRAVGLMEAVSPILDLLLPEVPIKECPIVGSDDEENTDVLPGMRALRPIARHDLRTFVVQISKFAILRITVLNIGGVCDSMIKMCKPREIRNILTQAHITGVQQQIALRRKGGFCFGELVNTSNKISDHAMKLLSCYSRRILGEVLGSMLTGVVERAALAAAGALPEIMHPNVEEVTGSCFASPSRSTPLCAQVETASASPLQGASSAATDTASDAGGPTDPANSAEAANETTKSREPVSLRLVIKNSFIELVDDESPKNLRRARSCNDVPSSVHEPYTFVANFLNQAHMSTVQANAKKRRHQTTAQASEPKQKTKVEEWLEPPAGATAPKYETQDALACQAEVTPEGSAGTSSAAAGAAHTTETREFTTVQLRNLPDNYTRVELEELLDSQGFCTKYNFLYLPMDFTYNTSLGYAMINMISAGAAADMQRRLDGFSAWARGREGGLCEATFCETTFEDHIERYRNSPVMHEIVPDEHKPVVFSAGQRVPFPAPNKVVRRPRIRHVKESARAPVA